MSRSIARGIGFLRLTNLRSLRKHPLRAALAILTVASGVAIIVAIAIELTSVEQSLDDFGTRLAGPAPIRVVGPTTRGGIDPPVVNAIANADGVAAAIPVIRAVTQLADAAEDRTVLVLGIDCSAQQLLGNFGCSTDPNKAATPAGAAIISQRLADSLTGDPVLRTNTGQLDLAAATAVGDLNDFNEGQVVLLPLPLADQLFARDGRVDVVYVLPDPGVQIDQLQADLSATLGDSHAVLDAADHRAVSTPRAYSCRCSVSSRSSVSASAACWCSRSSPCPSRSDAVILPYPVHWVHRPS